MRNDSYIINVARGKIIKEKDLVEALQKKYIAGAGLDVFENEPKIEKNYLNKAMLFLCRMREALQEVPD